MIENALNELNNLNAIEELEAIVAPGFPMLDPCL